MRRIVSLAVLLAVGILIIRLQPDDAAPTTQVQDAAPQPARVAEGRPDGAATGADADTRWVTVDRLNRRSCPSTACGIVGTLYYRERVTVYETAAGWARVTHAYDADCAWGRSAFVETGNDRCTAENGIVDGRLAEWVSLAFLAPERPPDPADGAEGIAALVAGSDDFRLHREAFVHAAEALIDRALCSSDDLAETGGFTRSTSFEAAEIYFVYCGGSTIASRFYLNAATGEIFQ